ncbi:MAG TPA: long-chain-fatty-acid--CoA ligase [Micromonosporaceae bacterium]|nr:long-chain-fatty-acid--CoA ligase [Micromonosporaceae bacterium]HCU50956.1 long-chain-fatty-acid--CoA ligase [Micromonosporaceae bacterium]
MNLASNLVASAERFPDRVAVRLDDRVWTYAELNEESAKIAGLLRAREIESGDRVALQMANLMQFPAVYYGILRVGAVVVPMNPLLKEREVEYYLNDSGAKLLFDEPSAFLAGHTASYEVTERADDDTAVILYTSGTTGKPKGAELTHLNLARNASVNVTTLLDLTHEDVVMGCLPLFHSFGQTVAMNSAVLVGAELTLVPRFDAGKALSVIERDRVTVFMGVPTMCAGMLNHPARAESDLSSVRVCVSGGAALPVELLHGFEKAFGAMILEGYGLSETSPVSSFNHPDRERKPGSIGTPIEGVEMKLVSVSPEGVGEIAIRGHNIMKGYWGNPSATAEAIPDGWFRTGDLAKQDEDGYFYIVDRKKDLIIRGGLNVYPREVEEVLYEHPAVAEAAVVALPHAELGEEIGAAVALKPGHSVAPEELSLFVKERLAAYKYPRRVWLVDELPKTATGKILRREVSAPPE